MTIAEALVIARKQSIAPHDAQQIIAHVIKKPHTFVIAHDEYQISKNHTTTINCLLARRAIGEPLAYLLGHKEFFGRSFSLSPYTLVPRPETEVLVSEALTILRNHPSFAGAPSVTVVDVGTGSGNIIITIATELRKNLEQLHLFATDIDSATLYTAKKNARDHGVYHDITFLSGDLIMPLYNHCQTLHVIKQPSSVSHPLLILANLPYVDSALRKTLLSTKESRGLAFEPPTALWADHGGLRLYDALFAQIIQLRKIHSAPIVVLCEIDATQKEPITRLIDSHFGPTTTIKFHDDLTGRPRVVEIAIH